MEENTLLHNPRCSKSRQALEILEEKEIEFETREYLKFPLSKLELQDVLEKLNITNIKDMIRTNEEEYKSLVEKYGEPGQSLALEWLEKYPKILQRPIFITQEEARIGRPPENILDIV